MTSSTDAARSLADQCSRAGGYCGNGLFDIVADLWARLVAAEAALADANRREEDAWDHELTEFFGIEEVWTPERLIEYLVARDRQLADANKRIEEMTADQPADPRPAIHDDAAEFDAQVRVHYDRYEAQLAAIRQQLNVMSASTIGAVRRHADHMLAVLDGVPGTTQPHDERAE